MTTGPPPSKIKKLDDSLVNTSDATRDLSLEVQNALEKIDKCQNDLDTLNEQASEEILQVEQKYNKLRHPHYMKRNAIIKNIPNFWVTAFANHPQIAGIMCGRDEECLQYLTSLYVEEFDDIKSGYKIQLHFSENPFFINDCVSKEFNVNTTGDLTCSCTEIRWKKGMDLTNQITPAQLGKHERKGLKQTFFQWLSDVSEPSSDDIAEMIKDEVWPNPLQYFLATDIEVDENGLESDESLENDDSVVVVDDDDDEEIEDEDEEELSGDMAELDEDQEGEQKDI